MCAVLKALAGCMRSCRFDAHVKWLPSAQSHNATHTMMLKLLSTSTAELSGAYGHAGRPAASVLFYGGAAAAQQVSPSSRRTSSGAALQHCSSPKTCIQSPIIGTKVASSCKHTHQQQQPAAAAAASTQSTYLHVRNIGSVLQTSFHIPVVAVAAEVEKGLQLQQVHNLAGRLPQGSVACDAVAEGTRGSRRYRSRKNGDITDITCLTSSSDSITITHQLGSSPGEPHASDVHSNNSSASNRGISRRRQQPAEQEQHGQPASVQVETSSSSSSDSNMPLRTQRRRQQAADTATLTAEQAQMQPHPMHGAAQAEVLQQQQQQPACRALLLGIDPDTSGAVAVVAASLLPYPATDSNSRPGTAALHCSSNNGTAGDCSGRQQQQQQQLVDLRGASVSVFDMPTEHIALRKKNKASPQRYRRRLDIPKTIMLIKQLIQQQEAWVPPTNSSSSSSDSSSSSRSKVMLRAFLEVSSISPTNGSLAVSNQGYSTGAWRAALLALGFEVSTIHVKQWKKDLGLMRCDKDASRQLAQQLYREAGQCQQHITKRKKDHGRAEALLIAAWGCGWCGTAGSSGNSSSSSSGDSSSNSRSTWHLHQGPLRAALQMDGGMHVLLTGDSANDGAAEACGGSGGDSCSSMLAAAAAPQPAARTKKAKGCKVQRRSKAHSIHKKPPPPPAAAAEKASKAQDTAVGGKIVSSNSNGSISDEPAAKVALSTRRKQLGG